MVELNTAQESKEQLEGTWRNYKSIVLPSRNIYLCSENYKEVTCVKVDKISASWTEEQDNMVLVNVSLEVNNVKSLKLMHAV